MNKKEYETIAESIWRSGYIEDKNKIRQKAREDMRKLIACVLIGSFKRDKNFDEASFLKNCKL